MHNKLLITILVAIMVLTGCAKDTPQEEVPNNNEVVEGTTTAVTTTSTPEIEEKNDVEEGTGVVDNTGNEEKKEPTEEEICSALKTIDGIYLETEETDKKKKQEDLVNQLYDKIAGILSTYDFYITADFVTSSKEVEINKNKYNLKIETENGCELDTYIYIKQDKITNNNTNNSVNDKNNSNSLNNSNLTLEEKCTLDPNCISSSESLELWPIEGLDNFRGDYSAASSYIDNAIIKKIAGTIMEETENSITFGVNDIYPLSVPYLNHSPYMKGGQWNNDEAIVTLSKQNTNLFNGIYAKRKMNVHFDTEPITWNASSEISLSSADIQNIINFATNPDTFINRNNQSIGKYKYEKLDNILLFEFETNSDYKGIEYSISSTGEEGFYSAEESLWINSANLKKDSYKNIVLIDTTNVTAFSMTSGTMNNQNNVLFVTYYDGKNRMGLSTSDGMGHYLAIQNYATLQEQRPDGNPYSEEDAIGTNMGVILLDYAIANK